jgi:hypothetical protein
MKERDHWEGLGVDGKIILNISSRSGMGRHGLDALVQNRDRWRALVNVVMNLRVPYRAGKFLTS